MKYGSVEILNKDIFYVGKGYSVYRWNPIFVDEIGTYKLISHNWELADMQETKRMHPVCIVDDFGNLVRKV